MYRWRHNTSAAYIVNGENLFGRAATEPIGNKMLIYVSLNDRNHIGYCYIEQPETSVLWKEHQVVGIADNFYNHYMIRIRWAPRADKKRINLYTKLAAVLSKPMVAMMDFFWRIYASLAHD